jgi:hypothetical protein
MHRGQKASTLPTAGMWHGRNRGRFGHTSKLCSRSQHQTHSGQRKELAHLLKRKMRRV